MVDQWLFMYIYSYVAILGMHSHIAAKFPCITRTLGTNPANLLQEIEVNLLMLTTACDFIPLHNLKK